MADFAKIESNIVTDVIVVNDEDCGGGQFPDSESIGQKFIASIGLEGQYLQTDFMGNYRGRYAGKGFTYDPESDIFIAPIQPEIEEPENE